jgi:surface antigen
MRRLLQGTLVALWLAGAPGSAPAQPARAKPAQRPAAAGASAGAAAPARVPADRAFQLAMETTRSDDASAWQDPETGASGVISPVKTFQAYDESVCRGRSPCYCREYDASTTKDGRTDLVHGTACRVGDGVWEIVGAK